MNPAYCSSDPALNFEECQSLLTISCHKYCRIHLLTVGYVWRNTCVWFRSVNQNVLQGLVLLKSLCFSHTQTSPISPVTHIQHRVSTDSCQLQLGNQTTNLCSADCQCFVSFAQNCIWVLPSRPNALLFPMLYCRLQ